jgi:DNA-binding transcriptional LysR family regulator
MDFRRLEVFVRLMETRSFSETAKKVLLRQPTVSGHIKTLEEEIGVRLFDRHGREVLPTSAAEVLYEYALRLLALRDEAVYALEQFMGRIRGHLKLGGSTIPGGYILPLLMGRFRKLYPEAYLSLLLDDTEGIIRRVLGGEIEIGLVGARSENEYLEYRPLIKDRLVLAAPRGQTFAPRGVLKDARELARLPFILREEGSGTRMTMAAALKKHELDLDDLTVVAEMGSTEAVRQAVKAGLGVSILSRLAVAEDLRFGLIDVIEVDGLNLERDFYAVVHARRTQSPLCRAFLAYLMEQGPQFTLETAGNV